MGLERSPQWTPRCMVLAGRRSAPRRELVEWLGGSFDPKAFDMDEVRERLAEYVEVSMPKNSTSV